jgi:hypothetical protein
MWIMDIINQAGSGQKLVRFFDQNYLNLSVFLSVLAIFGLENKTGNSLELPVFI